MIPANNIQPDFTPAESDSDIPAGIDAFLRELARWTVEDMRQRAVLELEDTHLDDGLANMDEISGFDQEPLLKKIS